MGKNLEGSLTQKLAPPKMKFFGIVTPFSYAHLSNTLEMNSLPLSPWVRRD